MGGLGSGRQWYSGAKATTEDYRAIDVRQTGARRMAESSALLVDEVFPHQPVRQWVLSFPFCRSASWRIYHCRFEPATC